MGFFPRQYHQVKSDFHNSSNTLYNYSALWRKTRNPNPVFYFIIWVESHCFTNKLKRRTERSEFVELNVFNIPFKLWSYQNDKISSIQRKRKKITKHSKKVIFFANVNIWVIDKIENKLEMTSLKLVRDPLTVEVTKPILN
jgi:hypothetical protein